MPTRILSALGAGAMVLVVALGLWGWTDHDESAARHASAIEARNKPRFCDSLGYAISSLTGQPLAPGLISGVATKPPPDDVLIGEADIVHTVFETQLLPSAPPVLTKDVENVADAAQQVSDSGSARPFHSGRVVGSLGNLARYMISECP